MQDNKQQGNTDPMDKKSEVDQSNDPRIDQDFNNFPHDPSKENIINPKTSTDFKVADAEDAEVRQRRNDGKIDEIQSDGSGGAFESTEEIPHNYGKNTDVEKNRKMEGSEDY